MTSISTQETLSRFSGNSEANALEFLENLEVMFSIICIMIYVAICMVPVFKELHFISGDFKIKLDVFSLMSRKELS